MSWLENPAVLGALGFVAGSAVGYWLWRWKERNVQAALVLRERAVLEDARRRAEAIRREASLQGDEHALQIRKQTEEAFASRRHELQQEEHQLVERESLINRQLLSVVEEEKLLRQQQDACERKSAELEAHRQHLLELERR